MAAFVSKIGVFSRFFLTLDFAAKMAEFPLPDLQIWRSRKRVAIQIQLMNIHVSECKCYCLQLVPKFGDMHDRQNRRLHPTNDVKTTWSWRHNDIIFALCVRWVILKRWRPLLVRVASPAATTPKVMSMSMMFLFVRNCKMCPQDAGSQ